MLETFDAACREVLSRAPDRGSNGSSIAFLKRSTLLIEDKISRCKLSTMSMTKSIQDSITAVPERRSCIKVIFSAV